MNRKRVLTFLLAICLAFSNINVSNLLLVSYARTEEEIAKEIEDLEIDLEDALNESDRLEIEIDATEDREERARLRAELNILKKKINQIESQLDKLYDEEPIEGPGMDGEEEEEIGPGVEQEEEEVEQEEPLSPTKPDTSGANTGNLSNLVVSGPIINSQPDSIRVTEIYSINNQKADCYYRPKFDDVPLLANRVLKMGSYAAAYTGFFDLDHTETVKPSGEASRALEILGYDFLLKEEKYDTNTEKYSNIVLGDNRITEETAIMDLYKALGIELFDIKMVHRKANYTSGNSPAAALLNRSTIEYSGGGDYPIYATDKMESYETYVFVTRTNPALYMKKVSQDFNVSVSSNKSMEMTNADFIKLAAKMMQFYGEPEMSTNEMNQLIQVYGEEIPSGMEDSLKEAWIYLKARGVLNIPDLDLYGFLTKEDMFDILMRIKDKESRVNYKDIQVTLSLNQEVINQGYYPSTDVTINQVERLPVESDVDYTKNKYYDYLIPITNYSRFVNQNGSQINTMFASDNPMGTGYAIEGSTYVGIEDQTYYHYRIPIDLNERYIYNNSYVRIDTPEATDSPGAIYLQLGGGVLVYDTYKEAENGERVNFFKRRPFLDTEFDDYVDVNRRDPSKEFNWDAWNENMNQSNGSTEEEEGSEEQPQKPEFDEIGFEDWDGAGVTEIADYHWYQDDKTGKWRCYENVGNEKQPLQAGVYYLGAKELEGDPRSHLYAFDNNGYMIIGWYQEGYYWYYFDENGRMLFNTTVIVDGTEYELDQYGRWIDMEYNIPEDTEDIWEYHDNTEGTWQLDDGKWWYMLTDGDWLSDGIYKIDDKFYAFDDEGYMRTGWVEYDDDYWYYFDLNDGYMYMNATTPDGIWCGDNGRAVGQWKLALMNSKLYQLAKSVFSPMTVYAAPDGRSEYTPEDISTLVGNNQRWYTHKIYKSMIEDTYDELKAKLSTNTLGEKIEDKGTYYVVTTKRSPADVMGNLKIKEDQKGSILTGADSLLNIGDDSKMLVPYIDLYNAGLVTNVKIDNSTQTVRLTAGIPKSTANGMSSFEGFGTIALDNNNNTVLAGTTIYRMSDDTTLYQILDAGPELRFDYTTETGEIKTESGKMLYVDLRVVFGWSGDKVSFFRDDTGQFHVTIGQRSIKNEDDGIEMYRDRITVENGKRYMDILVAKKNGEKRKLLVLNNMYPIANWCVVQSANRKSKEDYSIVVAYYKDIFEGMEAPNDMTKLANILQTKDGTPNFESYVYRVKDLAATNIQPLRDIASTNPGEFYKHSRYGLVYALPTDEEWKSQDGYTKYLNGEWILPIVSSNSWLIDKSVPYIEGKKYGTTVIEDANKLNTIYPQLAGLSYFLYQKQTNQKDLSDIELDLDGNTSPTTDLTDESLVYFGQNRLYKNSAGEYVIDGITHYNDIAKIEGDDDFDHRTYSAVNEYYSYGNSNTIGTSKSGTTVYVNTPDLVNYETHTSKDDERKSLFTNNGLSDIFNGYDEFNLNSMIKMIDETTSLVILFAMQVLPLLLFTLSMIVLLFSLMGEWKGVRMFCEKFFDPIEILTFGRRNIETANGLGYFVSVFITTISFALWANGNFLRVLAWLFAVFGEFMNILNNI